MLLIASGGTLLQHKLGKVTCIEYSGQKCYLRTAVRLGPSLAAYYIGCCKGCANNPVELPYELGKYKLVLPGAYVIE